MVDILIVIDVLINAKIIDSYLDLPDIFHTQKVYLVEFSTAHDIISVDNLRNYVWVLSVISYNILLTIDLPINISL